MTNLPEDEGLHVVRRNEPEPRLIYSAVSKPEAKTPDPETPDPFTFFTVGRISVIVGIVLFIGSLFASRYLIQQLHREASVPETRAPATIATAVPAAIPWVTADMLRVTSIALGDVHLAVVNGMRMAERDSLDLKTPAGVVTLRVTSIEDGVVHFAYDGKTIDAKLTASSSARKSP